MVLTDSMLPSSIASKSGLLRVDVMVEPHPILTAIRGPPPADRDCPSGVGKMQVDSVCSGLGRGPSTALRGSGSVESPFEGSGSVAYNRSQGDAPGWGCYAPLVRRSGQEFRARTTCLTRRSTVLACRVRMRGRHLQRRGIWGWLPSVARCAVHTRLLMISPSGWGGETEGVVSYQLSEVKGVIHPTNSPATASRTRSDLE